LSPQFGLLWPFRNPAFARVPWDELYSAHLELVVESEALGFDYAWLTEHHFVDDGYSPSLFSIGGAIAARTTRIRIGTFVLLLPMHNPVEVAENTATLDLISGGRFEIGVGLGYRRAEFDNQGIPRSNRGVRMEEGLAVIRRLLSDETVTFEGRFTKLRDLRITPPALQRPHPPIWAGGIAPKAIDRVARLGFHYLNGGAADPANAYDEALRDHGRDPQNFNIAGQRVVYVAPTREEAWAIAARPLHHVASEYLQWFVEESDDPQFEHTMASIPSVEEIIHAQEFDFFGEAAIVGTPEDAIAQIQDYVGRGRISHLVCALPLPGMTSEQIRSGMELFARKVIPHFRVGSESPEPVAIGEQQ
jgi:alkanesulfonate monooxygenase SsuD/methylene tetrahydromethanopterin reductase-like flavin-dependent oxidoreductase (luciferase family)